MLTLREMTEADIPEVMRIERSIYPWPWTAGNFSDSIGSHYYCQVAEIDGMTAGYAVVMLAPGEAHLLTVGIAQPFQRRGWGAVLLNRLLEMAGHAGMERMLLEVRPSNTAALALYRKCGFSRIGLRPGYYPADNGSREDAIVMERPLRNTDL